MSASSGTRTPARSRVITEPLGGSPLALAVQTRQLPSSLQPWWPSSLDEWRGQVERVRPAPVKGRDTWLDAIRPALAPSGAASERLDRVVAERGIVVTTGQQAGLLGGPLYTLAKAITSLCLADAIEQTLGIPAAPVFWAATDDADFLEASVAYVADADGLQGLKLEKRPPAGTPLSLAPLGAEVKPLLEHLRTACGSAAHAAYFELARTAFTRERTLGDAYVRLLRELLEPLGIAVMDSSHRAYRDAARPILTEALRRAAEIARATSERAAAIRQAGFEPQVEDDRGLSLVFALENGVKRRLSVEDARKYASADASQPALLPNVLLRPLVERELFPSVCYVAGPGELAYFTQANAVAGALGRDRVVGVPRWSCTIIEPFAERALRRLGVQYHEVRDIHALERRLATAALPDSVAAAWKRLQEQVRDSVRVLGAAVQDVSLMPPSVIEGLERSLAHRLGRAERRLIAAAKRRDERVRRDLEVVSAALFPMGKRQERVLNYIPMLTRGGEALVEDMKREAATHALSLLHAERAEPVAAR
jgi:bacillithiol biosynthesis cysteine-adding enzyme BshC